jgi:hypothetical protein
MTIPEAGWPGVIAAAIALLGVVFAALISFSVSRRASYLTSVTAERAKWIDKLRTNIAELAALCVIEHYKYTQVGGDRTAYDRSSEHAASLQRIETLAATIRLQLNPQASIDQNIIQILDHFYHFAERGDYRVFDAHWLIIRHSQWLLKEEWETVKYEASGWIRRCLLTMNRRRRERDYRDFCSNEGSLTEIKRLRRGDSG